MNYKEWKKACKEGLAPRKYDNLFREIQRSLKYNSDPKATVRHHLRDTEEQRKYNDDHYELWGFEIDENGNEHFEYGKYIIFVTEEWHSNYHKDSEETKQKKSDASKKRWEDPDYRESQTAAIIKVWSDDDRRRKRSAAYTGEGNPFYGKRHSPETLEKLSGENNSMYGKHHTEESRKKISEANKGKIVSQETRDRLSKAVSGEKNGMYGKKHTEEALEKLRHSRGVELQKQCSLAYKEYKSSGGTMKWQDFRREFFKSNK